jgi:Rhodanese-related sulfurtransferase
MYRQLLFILLLLTASDLLAQYKNDNVLYTTVDPDDLCATLQKNKGYLLLDVRSPGEHNDTSTSPGYNLGHLKGAKNINVTELGKRLAEINAYKDQPVFVYCSHSQRSRRASKMLADSGFTKVFNINGGMTALHYTGAAEKGCPDKMVETTNSYSIISAKELCEKMKEKKDNLLVLDVRPDSSWNHISLSAKDNAYGSVKKAVHISLADLPAKLGSVPAGKEIVLTDIYGDQASMAAILLKKNGYSNVSVLIEGIDRLLLTDEQDLPCKKDIYKPAAAYTLLNAAEFGRMAAKKNELVLLDVRSAEEFANNHKDSWRNIGRLKNAINIPVAAIGTRMAEIENYRNAAIVLYGFSSSPEVFTAANTLEQNGFTKIHILMGGIFNLRWTAANRKGQGGLKEWVVEVPEVNW